MRYYQVLQNISVLGVESDPLVYTILYDMAILKSSPCRMLTNTRFPCQDCSLIDEGQIEIADGVTTGIHLEDD